MRREVEKIAQLAEEYVEQKLKTARKNSLNNSSKKTYRILLDTTWKVRAIAIKKSGGVIFLCLDNDKLRTNYYS